MKQIEEFVAIFDQSGECYEIILRTVVEENKETKVPVWLVEHFRVCQYLY